MNGREVYGTLLAILGAILSCAVVFFNWHPSPDTCMVIAGWAMTIGGVAYSNSFRSKK